MSVHKSQRKESIAEYLQTTRTLRRSTIRVAKKLPNSYRYPISNNMLTLAADAFSNAAAADTTHLTKETQEDDYRLRHRYLMLALSKVNALQAEITFCYYLVQGESNIFKSKNAYNRTFQNWTNDAIKAENAIRRAIESDNKFWKDTHSKTTKEKEGEEKISSSSNDMNIEIEN